MTLRRSALLLGLLLVWACYGSQPDPLIGKWYSASEPGSSEFLADGTALIDDGTISLNANWARLPDGRVELEMTILGTTSAELFAVEVTGDRAIFTNSEGEVAVMTRESAVRDPG